MKRTLFLLLTTLALIGCSKDDDGKDELYERPVTESELESGTATYEQWGESAMHYLIFKDKTVSIFDYKAYGESSIDSYKYEIVGDSIYFIDTFHNIQKSAYICYIHLGSEIKVEKDPIFIEEGENSPYSLQPGFYNKSLTSLLDYNKQKVLH